MAPQAAWERSRCNSQGLAARGCLQRHPERKVSNWWWRWARMQLSTANARMLTIRRAASHLTAFDAILALAGGDALEKCLNALRPGGRLAHPNGIEPAPKKRRGMKLIRYDGISGVREFERLNAAVQAARLKVPIASHAQEPLSQRHVVAKI